ncbi:MAG: diguanylate cyclase [Clostridiales bacterium]|nr:diguanylate cyclase [Clostridiales bacterium]
MSIKNRILIPMVTMVILAVAATLIFNIVHFSNFFDEMIAYDLDHALSGIENEVFLLEEKAAFVASLYFAHDQTITAALESGDHALLTSRVHTLYGETEIQLCAVTDASGVVLACPSAPQLSGDSILAMRSIQSALSGESQTVTESGLLSGMAACSSSTIRGHDGSLLGAVVVGYRIDTDDFVDKHKSLTSCEITVFRMDERVATTVLLEDGSRAVGTKAQERISQMVLSGKEYNGPAKVLHYDAQTKYIPIQDADGHVNGMLFAGYYLTEKNNTIRSFITTDILIVAILLSISIPMILYISGHIAAPITRRLNQIHLDALTGIHNRRYFDEHLPALIKLLSRSNGSLSLMMIDVDNFKKYNDTYGHHEGDKCLRAVAETLSSCVTRASDFVARYGGEEFVVVLPNTDEGGARLVAEKMLESVRARSIPHQANDAASCVTISIGITSVCVDHSRSGEEYVKQADEMLYQSKQNGRNRYTIDHGKE